MEKVDMGRHAVALVYHIFRPAAAAVAVSSLAVAVAVDLLELLVVVETIKAAVAAVQVALPI
jgi:hypothetical protein